MPEAYLLSESDRKAVQSLLDENKSKRFNTANRPRTDNLDTEGIAPEVYIAYTPPAGIPALSESVGTGTPVGTGTGTSIDLDIVPGSNTCNIYRLLPDGLAEISGLKKVVNNLSNAAIDGNSWIVVVRDKFGTWYTTTGTGVGSGELWGILTAKGDGSPSPFSWAEVIETDTILAVPDAPAVSSSTSGGSIATGTYKVIVTYKNSLGREGRASPATSIAITGPTGTITVTSPSPSTGAINWNVYITFISNETGRTEPILQVLSPIAIGTDYTSSSISSTGDLPPGIFSPGGTHGGTLTVLPAYPANDPSTVTVGTIVRLIPSSTGDYYVFEDPETLISGQDILATGFPVPHLSASPFIEGGVYTLSISVLLPSKGIYLIQGDLSFDYFTDDNVFHPWIVEMWLTDPDIIQSTRRKISVPGTADDIFFTDGLWFTLPTHFLYTAHAPTIIGMSFRAPADSNITIFNVNGGEVPFAPHSSLHWVRLSTKTDDILQRFPFHLAQSKPTSKALIDPYKTTHNVEQRDTSSNTLPSVEPSSVRVSDTYYPPTIQKNKHTTSRITYDKAEPLTRHLLYHIHPVSGTGVWQQNVRSLLRRIELFNGHRVVAITTGRGESNRGEVLDSVQHVKDAFNGTVHEFIEVENDPDLREVQSFLPLYERVETLNPNHVCLWAHAKGVTSETERPNSVPIWRDLLYETYLDYWPLVEEQLKEYPITGAFYKTGLPDAWKGHTDSDWHYSGSWWWFRCSELFGQKDWRAIERFKYGIEPYPSLHFSKQQAGCLFFKGEYPTLELYSEKYLKETVLPAYRVWQRDHIQYRTQSINSR